MMMDRTGAAFIYGSTTYKIGERIHANAQSDWKGLSGTITEIRDGSDKETGNDGPDFYCSFDAPERPEEVKELEARFSTLYQHPLKIEDIPMDGVVMAPEMVWQLKECFHADGILSGTCTGKGNGSCRGCGLAPSGEGSAKSIWKGRG